MKIRTIRENSEPFGTEYSCMMALIVKGKLVIVRPGTKEFKAIEQIVLSSDKLSQRGVPKSATKDDFAFFSNALNDIKPSVKENFISAVNKPLVERR